MEKFYVSFVVVLQLPMCSPFRAFPICLTWFSMEFDRTKKTVYMELHKFLISVTGQSHWT